MSSDHRYQSAGYMTNWAARLFARSIDKHLKLLGISSGQLPVFFALSGAEKQTQKSLAAFAAVEQPTMAVLLNRMERDGLILREANPLDKRSSLFTLSPIAQEKLPQINAAIQAVNRAALSDLSVEEQEQYQIILQKIIQSLDQNLMG